jgi:hypothetical protein
MGRRKLNPKNAKEVIRLRKKQAQEGGLDSSEKRKLKKQTEKTDAALRNIVRDIRRDDP